MIAFILGTSEGKKIISLMNKKTDEIIITTATKYGGELLKDLKYKDINTKPLNKEEMENWLKENNVDILVDASHPYAAEVSKNAMDCSKKLSIKYIRYERKGILQNDNNNDIIRVYNYDEAIEYIKKLDGNVLNTTGGNNVEKFANIDFKYRIIHRILPSASVLKKVLDYGIEVQNILAIKGPITSELEEAFIKHYKIKAIITKDSGIEGGTLEKVMACRKCGVKIILIDRPKIEYENIFNNEEDLVNYLFTITEI